MVVKIDFTDRAFSKRKFHNKLAFDKKELGIILNVYGKMVATGEWRDYKISMFKNLSVFSIYKKTAENPIYMVKKNYLKQKKKYIFSVVGMDGKIMDIGYDLSLVLKPLELKLIRRVI